MMTSSEESEPRGFPQGFLRSVLDEGACSVERLPFVRFYNECPTRQDLHRLLSRDNDGTVRQQPHLILAAPCHYKKGATVLVEKPFIRYVSSAKTSRFKTLVQSLHAVMRIYPLNVLHYMAYTGYGEQYMASSSELDERRLRETFKQTLKVEDGCYKWQTSDEMSRLLFRIYRALLNTHRFSHKRDGEEFNEGFCLMLSRVTHDCAPNCVLSYRRTTGHLVLTTTRAIERNERLTLDHRITAKNCTPADLFRIANVYCCCARCITLYQEEEGKKISTMPQTTPQSSATKEEKRAALLKQATNEVMDTFMDNFMPGETQEAKQTLVEQTHKVVLEVARCLNL